MQEAEHWVIKEIKTIDLGDKRLDKRCGTLLKCLTDSPAKSIPASFQSWHETIAAYRFFNNEKVNYTDLLSPHYEATLARIKQEAIVLLPQDTTEINFTGRKPIAGMGPLRREESQGFYVHPTIALTPERLCLGLTDLHMWTRQALGSRKETHRRPLEEKESYRWLAGYEAANKVALSAPDTVVVSVADREGDIYDVLEKMPSQTHKAYWLIRSQHNRKILDASGEALDSRLREVVRGTQAIGEMTYELPAGKVFSRDRERKTREVRTVKQEIRASSVYLNPTERKGKKLTPVAINVVHCKEINPPSEEDCIEWFLLTSVPIPDAEAAMDIVKWYLCRFQIEVFFKILKSGCTVEELQFESLKATSNCLALYMIAAWRILYLTMLGRHCPEINCEVVFEANEWQSVYAIVMKQSPPKEPPTLNEIIIMIAKLGGFLARKSDKLPGSKVMWIGLQRMRDFTLAWQTFRAMG